MSATDEGKCTSMPSSSLKEAWLGISGCKADQRQRGCHSLSSLSLMAKSLEATKRRGETDAFGMREKSCLCLQALSECFLLPRLGI